MPIHLPNSLAGLLSKLGLSLGLEKVATKDEQAGLEGKAPKEGEVLGEEGLLLFGRGFNLKDKGKAKKNASEKENVDMFLKERPGESKKADAKEKAAKEQKGDDAQTESEAKPREQQELREERRQDVRREERAEEGRAQAQQESKDKDVQREKAEAQQQEQPRDDRDKDNERAQAIVLQEDDSAAEEDDPRFGLRDPDVLGDAHRCHGTQEDGTRCTRKPVQGNSFCREHMATRMSN